MNSGPPSARNDILQQHLTFGPGPIDDLLEQTCCLDFIKFEFQFWIESKSPAMQSYQPICNDDRKSGNPYLFHMNSIVVYNYYIQCMTHHNARKYPTNNNTYLDMDTISSAQRVDYI